MKTIKLAIGCDHAGFELKKKILDHPWFRDHEWIDFGTKSPESVDYPDFVHPTAEAVANGEAELGVVICGSGNGVAMTANKHPKIRAAVCWNTELAELARAHNNANILALASRFIDEETAFEILKAFLTTSFDGGRHARRVNKISHTPAP